MTSDSTLTTDDSPSPVEIAALSGTSRGATGLASKLAYSSVPSIFGIPEYTPKQPGASGAESGDSEVERPVPAGEEAGRHAEAAPVPGWVGVVRMAVAAAAASDPPAS